MTAFSYTAEIAVTCQACCETRKFTTQVAAGCRPLEPQVPRGWHVIDDFVVCDRHDIVVRPVTPNSERSYRVSFVSG